MTNEEAIKWVYDRMCFGRGTFTKNHPPNIDECWEAGGMAIKALERTGWIPVSERLPDYRRTVLVSTKWGVSIAFRDSINEGVTDDFWDCPLDDSTIATRYVTAWQPLPEPYKEKKNSDL